MNLAKTLVPFVLAIVFGYVAIGNSIPQLKSEPVEVITEIGESPEELIAVGKKIFTSDRAVCLTCHSLGEDPKARCPNQEGVGERAVTRKPGYSAAEYLIESVYNPNAFIVSGFPKNQMTPVNKPPIALSDDEILAVVSYLNALGGVTDEEFVEQARAAQDPWRKGLLTADTPLEVDRLPILPGDEARGAQLFEKIGCVQCHRIGDIGGAVAPELTAIGGSQGGAYILESILEPYEVIVKGYKQTLIVWKDAMRPDLQGVPVEWIPDQENPRQMLLSIPSNMVPVWRSASSSADDEGDDFFGAEEEEDFFGDDEAGEVEEDFFGEEEEADGFFEGDDEEQTGEENIAGADRIDFLVDLSEVASFGDCVVAVQTEDEFIRHVGDYIEGDEASGVTLSILEDGQWVQKRIEPDNIDFMTYPASVMPADFATIVKPQEAFDLVSYLLDQKGKP